MWIKIVKYKKLSFSYRKVGWSRSDMKRRSRDCAFYPDKKKGPGALGNGREFCRFSGTAGHQRDKIPTLVRKISL